MKLTKEKIISIAKRSKTYDDLVWNLLESLPRNRPILDGKIGEYVRIKSSTYGRKSASEFNLGVPQEGKIVKFNPKSVVVKVGKEKFKFPASAMVSSDISILEEIDLKSFYVNLRKK